MESDVAHRFESAWRWLTQPAKSIRDPDRRQQAALLSASLWVFTVASVIGTAVSFLLDPAVLKATHHIPLVLVVVLGAAYGLSRTAWARAAAVLAVAIPIAVVLVSVWLGPWSSATGTVLGFLSLAVLLSSLVFSLLTTLSLAVAAIASVSTLPLWVTGATWAQVAPALDLIMLMSVLVISSMVVRRHQFSQRERQWLQVAMTHRISAAINASLRPQDVLNVTCRELAAAAGVPMAFVARLDEDASTLTVVAEHRKPEHPSALGIALQVADHPALTRVLEEQEALAVPDAKQDTRLLSMHDLLGQRGVISILFVPLVVGGIAVGFAGLEACERTLFSQDHVVVAEGAVVAAGLSLERGQLFEAERESRRLAETLSEIAQELNLAPDLETALNLVLARMGQVISFDSGSILLLEGGLMRVVALRGFTRPEQVLGTTLDLEASMLNKQVIETRRPLILGSAAEDPRWIQAVETSGLAPHLQGIQAWMGVPLLIRDRVIGMLTADRRIPYAYHDHDAELALAFGGHAAIAIENARLLEAERAQLRLAQTLQEVGALLTTRLSLDELLEQIFDLLSRVVRYDSVSIQLVDDGGNMEMAAGRGFLDLEVARQMVRDFYDKSVEDRWGAHKVIVVPDTQRDDRWVQLPGSEHIRSWTGAALMVKGQVFGVLNVDSGTANAYDSSTAETVAAFANQAAVAIESKRLYDRVRRELTERLAVEREHQSVLRDLERRHTQLHAAAEISKSASTILAPAELMQLSVNLIQERFGFYHVGIYLLEPPGEYGVLRAGSGEAGARLLAAGHRLRIDAESIVGWCISRAQARIALDDGPEAACSEDPLLPEARSQVALPLITRGECIGALAVHSHEEAAFLGEDVVVLQTMADHLAVAIENARLYDAAQREIGRRARAEEEIKLLYGSLERRVSERTADLAAVNRELEAFGHSVSHDLRAPMRRVMSFSQALRADHSSQLDAEGLDYLRRLESAGRQMTELIDALLVLSRISRREMHRETVDLSSQARMLAADLQQTQPQRPVEFRIANDIVANGDPHLLRIVLENLLSNAWKFTSYRDHSVIEFGAVVQGTGEKVFFVRDNGAGFDMTYVDWLFTAFRRLHPAEEFEGTGIGLATVQRIIHRHGGRVWAEGAQGKGATFFFTV